MADHSEARSAAVASEDAAVLQTAGQREADVLQTAGAREAEALQAAGVREAAILTKAGQRDINRLWEDTQMRVAMRVVNGVLIGNLAVVVAFTALLALTWKSIDPSALAVLIALVSGSLGSLGSMGSLVIGFYFSRTNHTKVGGVGASDVGR